MSSSHESCFVSRAGLKLAHALNVFGVDPQSWICADIGSNAGGFVDCLLQHGASRVYAIERGYGVLDYRLRSDRRVVVMERTDALHARLPEKARLVTIDAGWTRQHVILPAALRLLNADGIIITLVKPHYEADAEKLEGGVLLGEHVDGVLASVDADIGTLGLSCVGEVESPIRGHGGNREFLRLLRRDDSTHTP